ncbi:MAG: aspartate kinase [Desulfobacteraceae bacterium]|nr:aspartate kinase [Desulfobacteraceae bacterium]MBC2752916.1 aspartate kinase [Desulfobacteraceae bacterium]
MRVIKVGGGCLNGKKTIESIVDLIACRGKGHVFVLSALHGITDFLITSLQTALVDETQIPLITGKLKTRHLLVARHLIQPKQNLKEYTRELEKSLGKLERLYYGLNFTRAITPRLTDVISSYGERLSAQLLTAILRSRGLSATCRMPHEIGLITDGKYGDATADLTKTSRHFKTHLSPLIGGDKILFLPGFFGTSEEGEITTFGRGGSDYSAAVAAVALDAERLDIWKDTEGFMSADPRLVPEARLIPVLSYEEAAELAYFGAKILHPRTVEPARRRKMNIAIKNTLAPDAEGSLITSRSARPKHVIKSVAYDTDIGILKVHASGVGARPGILGEVATCVADSGINIKSVVTSQTCISLLLAQKDMEKARQALMGIRPRPFRKLDRLTDVALIGIVGDGIQHRDGIAARCFTAVANCRVNVEMISFGPSRAALYFLVKKKDLESGVNAIHSTFFSTPRCRRQG